MTQAFRLLSATNGYLPLATQYIVSYIRRKEQFKFNEYIQLVNAPAPHFYYWELDPDQSVRIRNAALHLWADGADRPSRRDNQFGFRALEATCLRYDFGSTIGNIALSMADKSWSAKQVYLQGIASQAMTARTMVLWQGVGTGGWLGLDNASTWPTGNVADAGTLNGAGAAGTWDKASSDEGDVAFMAIRKSLYAAANTIFQYTNGVVQWKDLILVISPDLARVMGNTGEIRDYYKYGPFAKEAVETAMSPNYNECYGLPPSLYGIKVVVEDAVIIQDTPSAAQTGYDNTRTFIKNGTKAVLMSRKGGIDAQVGPAFSTAQVYWFNNQLTVKEFVDPKNEVTEFHMEDFYIPVLTGGRAGFLITSCV